MRLQVIGRKWEKNSTRNYVTETCNKIERLYMCDFLHLLVSTYFVHGPCFWKSCLIFYMFRSNTYSLVDKLRGVYISVSSYVWYIFDYLVEPSEITFIFQRYAYFSVDPTANLWARNCVWDDTIAEPSASILPAAIRYPVLCRREDSIRECSCRHPR